MSGQRGLSLIELLVSITILALATTVALVVYDQARLAYKHGENVTEQQQIVRIAFDIVSSDIRMAGFNTYPDGNRSRPDEQIEAAYATAVTVRADFDGDDPVDADLPEQSLGGTGSAFSAVSTGNDEIVTYVLAKEDGSSSDTLTFNADVGDTVRDATVEEISIDWVDLVHDDPPYTLYKMVLENDSTGCCGGSFARRVPIVDNVRSMNLRYYDRAGNEITPPGGEETTTAVAIRATIRRVELEIEALTRDSDPHWVDPDDLDPDTQRYRKFKLTGEIAPPNLGRSAIRDLQAGGGPPSRPATPSLYPGHCEGLYVSWAANPVQDDVSYYRIKYGTSSTNLTEVRSSTLPGIYLEGLAHGTRYYVGIQAVDVSGATSTLSPIAEETTTNTNTPKQAWSLQALANGKVVDLTWAATAENTAATTGDPASPMIRDLAGYRVYRDGGFDFSTNAANRIADESEVLNLPIPVFTDRRVPACRPQVYRVAAIDGCGLEGEASNESMAQTWTDIDPIAPMDVAAFDAAPGVVRVTWSAVEENADGELIYVGNYKIFRSPKQPDSSTGPDSLTEIAQVSDVTEYLDTIIVDPGYTVYYAVQALDDCSPANTSIMSDPAQPMCKFSGRVRITEPDYGATVQGDTMLRVEVQGASPTATNTNVELTFLKEATGDTTSTVIGSGGSSWPYLWDVSPTANPVGFFDGGSFLVTAEVTQTIGPDTCRARASIRVSQP